WILEALLDLAAALRRMLDVPASGSPKGIGRRHRITVSQPIPDLVQVKELMMGSELKANPSRRICNLGGQAYHLELVVQLACNDLNDLTERVLDFVAAIENLAGRLVGMVHCQQHPMSQVPRIPMRQQAKAAFRQDYEGAVIQRSTD